MNNPGVKEFKKGMIIFDLASRPPVYLLEVIEHKHKINSYEYSDFTLKVLTIKGEVRVYEKQSQYHWHDYDALIETRQKSLNKFIANRKKLSDVVKGN